MTSFFDFNIGHLITILGGILSITVVWQKTRDKLEELGTRVNKQEHVIDAYSQMGLLTTVAQHERRLQEVEAVMRDLGAIRTDIEWIKDKMNGRG